MCITDDASSSAHQLAIVESQLKRPVHFCFVLQQQYSVLFHNTLTFFRPVLEHRLFVSLSLTSTSYTSSSIFSAQLHHSSVMYSQTLIISLLAGLAAASPVEVRQLLGGTGTSSNEFSQGGCRDILFAWARGSTEIGNMVSKYRDQYLNITDTLGYDRWSSHFRRIEANFRTRYRGHRGHRLRRSHIHERSSWRYRWPIREAND